MEIDDMKRKKLLERLRRHEEASVNSSGGDLAAAQVIAWAAYLKDPAFISKQEKDEREGVQLSQFVSGDVADAVDSVQSRLLSIVFKQPRFVDVESETAEDAEEAELQGLKIESVMRDEQVDGQRPLRDWAKLGLLGKIGLTRVQVVRCEPEPFLLEGLTFFRMLACLEGQEAGGYEVSLPIDADGGKSPVDFPPNGVSFTVRGKLPALVKVVVQCLPPECLILSPYCETLDQSDNRGAQYVGVREDISVGRAVEMFPDLRAGLRDPESDLYARVMGGSGKDRLVDDERRHLRFDTDASSTDGTETSRNVDGVELTHYEEHVRFDLNGDGFDELLRVNRLGQHIVDVEEVTDNNLAWWTPFPLPNKVVGESLADKVFEFQDVNTRLIRHGLNAAAMAVTPRLLIDARSMAGSDVETADTIDAMVRGGIGSIGEVGGNPNEMIRELAPGENSARTAFEFADMFKGAREERVGITPMTKGYGGSTPINRTAAGMAMGMTASSAFINDIADNFSAGLGILALKIRDALRQSGELARVRRGDEMLVIDPSRWSRLKIRVNAGVAMINHTERQTFLAMMLQEQKSVLDMFGLMNPMCSLPQLRSTLVEMAAVMGYRDPERFFRAVSPEQVQALAEEMAANNPAAAELELKRELAAGELELKREVAAIELESKREVAQTDAQMRLMEQQSGAQLDVAKMQTEAQLKAAQARLEHELRLLQMRLDAAIKRGESVAGVQVKRLEAQIDAAQRARQQNIEAQLEIRQQNIEAGLERRGQVIEAGLKRREIAENAKISGVRSGGKVG